MSVVLYREVFQNVLYRTFHGSSVSDTSLIKAPCKMSLHCNDGLNFFVGGYPNVQLRVVPSVQMIVPYLFAYFTPNAKLSFNASFTLRKVTGVNYMNTQPLLWVYFNGQRVNRPPPSNRNPNDDFILVPAGLQASFEVTSDTGVTVTLSIPSVQMELSRGVFELVFLLSTGSSVFDNLRQCCSQYDGFLTDENRIGLQFFVVGLATVRLKQAGKQDGQP